MRRVLMPIDETRCGLKAVEYAAAQYAGVEDLEITLVHVMPQLPALFWDDGHILAGTEARERSKWVTSWLAKHRRKIAPILKSVAALLVKRGFRPEQVKTRLIEDADDAAHGILDEARRGGYQTILIGRCGIAEGKHFLVGSLTSKLIHQGAGIALCIVE